MDKWREFVYNEPAKNNKPVLFSEHYFLTNLLIFEGNQDNGSTKKTNIKS
jgi:hypothetical protein